MDRKLQKPQHNNRTHSFLKPNQRSFHVGVSQPKRHLLVILVACAGVVFQTGCQTQRLWDTQTALPVPPKVLDAETLQSVRFQSPGGSGSRGGGGSGSRGGEAEFAAAPAKIQSDVVPDFEQLVDTDGGLKPDIVKQVIITGNQQTPTHHLTRNIRTRQGRYFDPDKLQQDVNMLWRLPEIKKVKGPYLDRHPDGVVIRIEVEERQRLSAVSFIGNRGISDRTLQKKSGLEDGIPLDVHGIRMAKTSIEELYKEEGYPRTQVEILENERNDNSVTFLIHEDQKQKIWKVNFEGNTIATEARLRHIVKSKPGIAKLFGGLAKRSEIEQDIQRLTSYYRSLGFYNAQVGREISESNDGRWLSLRFIINEGPRYRVREVKFIGNQAFNESQLASLVTMHPSKTMPNFNVAIVNEDLKEIRDLYGSQGFVFSDINVDTRFLEEPGLVDLVYKIKEGKQYRVGQVNVRYEGGNSVTKSSVIRSRVDLRPGDLIDMRKIEASKSRLTRSEIFAAGQGGSPPSIAIKPRELKDIESLADLDNASSSYSRTARATGSSGGSGSSNGSGTR